MRLRSAEAKVEKARQSEQEMEQKVVRYVELLLRDEEGNPRQAIADQLLPPNAEPGNTTARAVFYEHEGGYLIDEYRNNGTRPVFTEYMAPNPDYSPALPSDESKWLVGMLRNRWMRFSEHGNTIKPFLGVLEDYFGKLPG